MATGAVDTFEFICTTIIVVVALPTLGTDCSSLATASAMTISLPVEAMQWVWNVHRNRCSDISYLEIFWNSRKMKCDYERVGVSSAATVVFDSNVGDIDNTFPLESAEDLVPITVNRIPTSDNTFAVFRDLCRLTVMGQSARICSLMVL